jgi:hypothetical protein
MKRILIAGVIACTIAALPGTASAQQVGVKAGVNSATLDGLTDFPENKRRLGLVAGVWVRVPVSGRFSFQAEGLFSEKGIAFEGLEEEGVEIDGDIRIRYFEVPLLGRFDLGTPGSTSGFYVFAGAAPAFKLSARFKAEAGDVEEEEDFSDEVESMDLGLVGGAGFEFGAVSIEGRYTHGLMDLSKDESETDKPKNRVFSVMVGYRFR